MGIRDLCKFDLSVELRLYWTVTNEIEIRPKNLRLSESNIIKIRRVMSTIKHRDGPTYILLKYGNKVIYEV
jgi:hypothetical protein